MKHPLFGLNMTPCRQKSAMAPIRDLALQFSCPRKKNAAEDHLRGKRAVNGSGQFKV
jgi:hypothetical protein